MHSHWTINESPMSTYQALTSSAESSFSKMSDIITSGPGASYGYGRVIKQPTIYSVLVDNTQITTASADSVVPTFQVPVRLVGNSEIIESDYYWLQNVKKVFSYGTFTDTNFSIEVPYSPTYIKNNDYTNYSNYLVANFVYDYNYYLKEYQQYISAIDDIKLIPNYYFLLSGYLGFENENEDLQNFISLEDTYPIKHIFKDVNSRYPPTYDIDRGSIDPLTKEYIDELEIVKSYLSDSLIEAELSASSDAFVASNTGVLFFNTDSQKRLFDTSFGNKHKMPFYTKLSLPFDNTASRAFGDMIHESGFENLMLNYLKEKFIDEKNFDKTSYAIMQSKISSSADAVEEITSATHYSYPTIDLFSMILDNIADSNNVNASDFYIVGDQETTREKIINDNGRSRYDHTIPSLTLLKNVNDYLKSNFSFSTDWEKPSMEEILDTAGSPRHSEILAYRIEKLGYRSVPSLNAPGASGPAPGTATRQALQNFLIFNSENLVDSSDSGENFVLYDTQVKYGNEYHYNVYAYILVFGYNYSYDNLVVSRQIAKAETSDGSDDVYCLEFFNPGSGESASRLSTISGITGISTFENDLFTDAQDSSLEPYLADFNFRVEPTVKILEIPIFSKPITVIDHPLQKIDLYNFQRMDSSQIIGFLSNLEAFTPAEYPKTLLPEEEFAKAIYLFSNDLLDTEEIAENCRSKPTAVQVFRKTTRPTAINDFVRSDLVSSKDLGMKNPNYKLSNCIYEEKIQTNRKYYYVLRFVSENGTYGQLSNIVEAELVNDGGYLYSLFEEYSDSDFEEEIPSAIAEQFKKIFHLKPNIGQLVFDDSEVDYSNNAFEEIQNMAVGSLQESIFDKTFKIRLTSKKTGKKIDLNVTYKLNNM